jgi:Uma2 family endonuclease
MSTTTHTTTPNADPIPGDPAPGDRDDCVRFRAGWDAYVALNDAVGEDCRARMIYANGELTILVTSRRHDWYVELLGQFLRAVALACGVRWDEAGSATYRRPEMDAGSEGDKVFYLGEHARQMRGPVNIDLATQPPPDLAIEVELSHSADAALVAWGCIGVPEVWRFDAEAWTFVFCGRRDDGTYATSDRSALFPVLTAGDVIAQLRLAEELGPYDWTIQLNDWTRDVLRPRLGGGG